MIDVLVERLIKPFEGLHRLVRGEVHPYICPAGYATQGYGLLVKDMSVPPISVDEAERRLEAAVPYYIALAIKTCPNLRNAPPGVLIAVADFTFNLGVGRLRSSTLKRHLDAGDWDAAINELPKWVFGGGRKLPGLVLRRAAEAAVARGSLGDTE